MAARNTEEGENVDLQLSQFMRSVKRERKQFWISLFARYEVPENNFEGSPVSQAANPPACYIDGTPTRLQKLVEFGEKMRNRSVSNLQVEADDSTTKTPSRTPARQKAFEQKARRTLSSARSGSTPSRTPVSRRNSRARSGEKPASVTSKAALTPAVPRAKRGRSAAVATPKFSNVTPKATSTPAVPRTKRRRTVAVATSETSPTVQAGVSGLSSSASEPCLTTPRGTWNPTGVLVDSAESNTVINSPDIPIPVIPITSLRRVSIFSKFSDPDEGEVTLML